MSGRRVSPRPVSKARLFDEPAHGETARPAAYTFQMDGAARGNPGPASYGVVVRDPGGAVVDRLKKAIGRATNNVAEYYALIAVLDYAQSHNVRDLRVESDSELLVRQLLGGYKVKSAELRPLFERAKKMSSGFASFRIEHVRREHNREADALANAALDDASGGARQPNYFEGELLSSGDLSSEQHYKKQPASRRFRAVVRAGVLHPSTPLDLPDGTEVEFHVLARPKPR